MFLYSHNPSASSFRHSLWPDFILFFSILWPYLLLLLLHLPLLLYSEVHVQEPIVPDQQADFQWLVPEVEGGRTGDEKSEDTKD